MEKNIKSITLIVIFILSITTSIVVIADTTIFIEIFDVSSNGTSVLSTVLEDEKTYKITAKEVFEYNKESNLCADPMYYTDEYPESWNWSSYNVAPNNHSFLQINGKDINWGSFSNGDTNHTYSIFYNGEGESITFQIIDWIDGNYTNNICHINVRIEEVQSQHTQIQMNISKGWNLIGFTYPPIESEIEHFLTEPHPNILGIYSLYNNTWGYWLPNLPSTLNKINSCRGYWIKSNNNTSIKYNGTNPVKVETVPGWNIIAYNSNHNTSVSDFIDNINGSVSSVYGFDNINKKYSYWIFGLPEKSQTLTTIDPHKGYIIYID